MSYFLDTRLSPAAARFLAQEKRLLIGGDWVAPKSGEAIDVYDPSTAKLIGKIPAGNADDIDAAVQAAQRAFEGPWSKIKPNERAKLMWKLADLLESNRDELAELESIDNGKPITMAKGGIAGTAEMLRYMAGWATKLNGETVNVSMKGEWHAYTRREPVGVVGQIIPWNFPLNMAVWKIAPALCVGCTIVLKPAEQASLVVLRLGELVLEAGFPAGVVNVVTGLGSVAGAALASHRGVSKVAFTGSTETGKRIVQASLGNLKRVSLELGGKSPVIVFADADLRKAAAGAAHAIFNATGQTCSAGSRLYVQRGAYDEVVRELKHHAQQLVVGAGLDPKTEMGPVVSDVQLKRVKGYIEQGRQCGAEVMAVGNSLEDSGGYFVRPTIITEVTADMPPFREEIFGPVVCVVPFEGDDLDMVAGLANDTPYGLFASIWTHDLRRAHALAKRIHAGTVGVNAHFVHDASMPFGGFKQSGWGRERGSQVLDLYTEHKSVAVNLD